MHLGDKLKIYRNGKDLDQFQMAELVKVSHRKYQQIEKTGIVQKVGDLKVIKDILGESTQISAHEENKIDASKDSYISIIANLTESNRMLAEAQLKLANTISSGGTWQAFSDDNQEDTNKRKDVVELPLSDKIGAGVSKKNKPKGILKSAGR